jgi:hypothetical protein
LADFEQLGDRPDRDAELFRGLATLSLLCFVLKPIDPVTGEALEPTNALYIACEHPPYNDAKLYD